MTFQDWRDADDETIGALFRSEQDRWRTDLGWETGASWDIVDQGRRRGGVPGWILRNRSGEPVGWTYYILHDGELQIGGLTADRATDVRLLLDRVLDSPEATLAASVSAFVFPVPPSLVSALTRRRFAVRRSLYLSRPIAPDPVQCPAEIPGIRFRTFEERDVFPAMRLLAEAYEGVAGAECFAPHGRLDEWVRYLRQLIDTPACGRWQRDASFVAEDTAGVRLTGVIVTTALSDKTAHIAQLVVGRHGRGRGVGAALVNRACETARLARCTSMTLMVDEGNAAARRVYDSQQFVERSAFLYARRRGQVRMPVLVAQGRRAAG